VRSDLPDLLPTAVRLRSNSQGRLYSPTRLIPRQRGQHYSWRLFQRKSRNEKSRSSNLPTLLAMGTWRSHVLDREYSRFRQLEYLSARPAYGSPDDYNANRFHYCLMKILFRNTFFLNP